MRRTSHRDDPERGLSVALKALAVVAAVAILALVAGKSAYTTGAASEASPTYLMLHPARDETPMVGAAAAANPDQHHMMAAGPTGAGMAPREPQMQESGRVASAPDDAPVATF